MSCIFHESDHVKTSIRFIEGCAFLKIDLNVIFFVNLIN